MPELITLEEAVRQVIATRADWEAASVQLGIAVEQARRELLDKKERK